MFSQLKDSQALTQVGIGLGLYITKQLVELQDGKIKIESEYGKGSQFTVQFPLS